MAGLYIRRNPPFAGKDELAGAFTNGNSMPIISRASIPAPAQAPAPILAPALTLDLPGRYTDEDLQRATNLALELFVKSQEHGQL